MIKIIMMIITIRRLHTDKDEIHKMSWTSVPLWWGHCTEQIDKYVFQA